MRHSLPFLCWQKTTSIPLKVVTSVQLPLTPLPNAVAGVLYIHVHSGSDLLPSDSDGLSDPYCVVLLNKKQVCWLAISVAMLCADLHR